ncbi:hypothetical protein AVEN_169957-1 [Araneus ventricosus]|uniref:Uncharacterized protein n=1 Tax=Araneus ventricosus TaxID=182803 RepID=A0A4Y2M459_ARAVE|nr:hypothetical protein AVEN_169957-1 [Araneus ventricosus]
MEWSITLKQDIHGKTVPVHFEHIAPHDSNFQPIHLDGSFAGWTAPTVNHHLRAMRSPRVTTPTPPPLSREPSLPLPHFVVFAFVREARFPSPRSYFSFMAHRAEYGTG